MARCSAHIVLDHLSVIAVFLIPDVFLIVFNKMSLISELTPKQANSKASFVAHKQGNSCRYFNRQSIIILSYL